ncbi:acetyl-CoA carboxylase, biotin carboxyl carrier protein [bacterium]|nr:acetyl-CoA carboxylase, biotin carboxyl carrier protein [bacterium]MBU1615284.1 acetyl-CoA carboxylase, biotin carboxyl carrier protein [bacterium]
MNLREIKELSNLMDEKQVVELEIEETGVFRTKIRKASGEIRPALTSTSAKPREITCEEKEQEEKEEFTTITSPLVGTFFRASAPQNPPYVEAGDNISKGQMLCNIVAMKTQNEVRSEAEGEMVEVLAENGHPVEYGQGLFLVRPFIKKNLATENTEDTEKIKDFL